MLKIRFAIASLCVAMFLPAAPALRAQTEGVAPDAPIPTQILIAKKVFISNAFGIGDYIHVDDNKKWIGPADHLYNQLYATIKASERYQIVGAPAEADIVLQISLRVQSIGIKALRMDVLDPRTNVVLWRFEELVPERALERPKGDGREADELVDKLVGDLKALAAQSVPAAK